jgi:hypothetical protein
MSEGILIGLIRQTERITSPGKDTVDARFVLLFMFISIAGINLSSYDPAISLIAIFSSLLYILSFGDISRIKGSITVAIPFIAFFSFTSFILTSDPKISIKSALFILSLISMNAILLNVPSKNLLMALNYFRLPSSLSFMIMLSLRLISLYTKDLLNTIETISLSNTGGKFRVYTKIAKAFASVMVLRAISISEAIYLRELDGENYQIKPEFNKIDKREIFLLFSSLFTLTFALMMVWFDPAGF